MKKTFRSILAGAVALLAVSCYDDSGLRDDIKKLDERVTAIENVLNAEVNGINDLATRLAAAEQALATANTTVTELVSQLDAVDGKVDGKVADFEAAIATLTAADKTLDDKIVAAIAKIAVVNVEEKDGKVVLTLSDNTTVALSKPLANVDNTNLVTITDENMWAVVNADGTVTSLDIPVGHPDVAVEFQVSSTGELQYSVNGGEWEDTGVNTSDISGQKYVINDVSLYDEEKCVVITIGDVEYTLPLYSTDSSVLAIKSGKTYFDYGEEKTIDVAITDIKQIDLMTKPDGWRAKLNGKKLTVTAPLEANVLSGVSEAEGEILFHCITKEGGCKVAKLMVATTKGFSLTLADDGTLTIVNPFVVTTNHMIWGEQTDFRDAYIGLATVADFEAGHEAYLESVVYEETDDKNTYISNWKSNTIEYDDVTETAIYKVGGAYEPGVYEEDIITTTVAEMYADWTYGQELPSSPYVVWACPVDEDGKPQIEELVFAYYTPPVKATVEAVSITTSDVEMKVSVQGAEEYYLNIIPESSTYGFPIDDYMTLQGEGPFSQFQSCVQMGGFYLQWAFQSMGMPFGGENGYEMPETIKVSDIMGGALMPGSKVYVCVFPIVEGLDLADYTYEKNLKPYIYEFTTNGLQPGGVATVSLEAGESTFEQIVVNVEASDDATMVFYKFYNSESIDKMSAEDVVATGVPADPADGPIEARENVSGPGVEMTMAAVAVDADYKYGEMAVGVFKSKELVYSETFKVELGEPTYVLSTVGEGYAYDFPINVTGGEVKTYHYLFSTEEYDDEKAKQLPLGYIVGLVYKQDAPVLNGLYANAGQTYYLYIVAESTTGEYAELVKQTVVVPALPAAE